MQKNIIKTVRNFKLALVALFVMLNASAFAMAQDTTTTLKAETTASGEAKRILANMPSQTSSNTKTIASRDSAADRKLRGQMARAEAALKAIANNTSPAREATLIAKFNRAIKDLKALPGGQPTAAGTHHCDQQYEICMELCKETGANCKLCVLGNEGCYLTRLAIEMNKNPLDPTP